MTKRPLSLTIIAWVLIVLGLFGLYGALTLGSNPMAAKMLEQSPVPLVVNQVWSVIGCLVGFIVAYGIFKAQPWSRVLYVVWSLIQIVVGLYISPMKSLLVFSFIVLVVISIFLFSEKANDYFSARGFMLRREAER
ncbi:MAG TPA: hypothetical protein VE820_13350 [Sphingomicrobium sp.]|jgi:uncharacterized membrane protein|nr:hypothetical protein [Sphingomicrobium sp.]